ncbi:MAG: hypothetical protein Kow0022_13010 [Phycisphaerales bacterium]
MHRVTLFGLAVILAGPQSLAQQTEPEPRATPIRAIRPTQPTLRPSAEEASPTPARADQQPAGDEPTIRFDTFSEPVELSTLVDYVGSTLGINIVVKGPLSGTVTFNAPIGVPKADLLDLLDALLEQYDFSIAQDSSGIYIVQPRANTAPTFSSDRATSKIIDTAGIRPSGLQSAIQTLLGQQGAAGGQGQQNIAYIDELGVIVMTGPTRNIQRVEELIENLRKRYLEARFTRIELDHIAAPVARDRVISLVGGGTDTTTSARQAARANPQQAPNAPNVVQGSSGGALDNIADRLTVDAQSNALIFRGNDTELAQVLDVIRVIDVPNNLESRQYFAGSSVQSIADLAKQRGFGEVITLQDSTSNALDSAFNFAQNRMFNPAGQNSQQQVVGGPFMIVDLRRQTIIYYGTPAQQAELAAWIDLLDVGEDIITLEYYKLSNARAADVAEIIQGLISGQSLSAESPLLPGGGGQSLQRQIQQMPIVSQSSSGEEGFAPDPNRVFVIADEANNQVIVKAPKKQQNEFAKLVNRLDLRRPQVYLQALIVSISDTRNFRLAVESQLAAGQYQAQTNFGLGTPGNTFQDPRTVATGLQGFTSALIRSDMIPFIINALRTDTDSRILSAPQLLVNDNEEASIEAIDQQPTTSTNQGTATTTVSFTGYEDAGTRLTVTPTISEAGYIRLEYEVTLSSFIGQGSNGIPAPRSNNTVNGIATIPSDATIVVGGIEVENKSSTIVRVPLLGDIPLIGPLFRDTNKGNTKSLLYIFITPRIMTDPNFQDLRLLTRGPQAQASISPDLPKLSPSRIEAVMPIQVPAKPEDEADDPLGVEGKP